MKKDQTETRDDRATSGTSDASDVAVTDEAPKQHLTVALWEPRRASTSVMWEGEPDRLRLALEEAATKEKGQTVVDVWLQSGGGLADAAYQHMLAIRDVADEVRVVVGRRAKSAATLFAVGADHIYMNPMSELGPLDAQIFVEESPSGAHLDRRISALDIAKAAEHMAEKAILIAMVHGGTVHQLTSLPRREVLPHILSFAADYVRPIVSKLEPADLYRAQSQLNIARDYAMRLLARRSNPIDPSEADELVAALIENYPDHGFVIDWIEARDMLNLPVARRDKYEFAADFDAITPMLDSLNVHTVDVLDTAAIRQALSSESDHDGPAEPAQDDGEVPDGPADDDSFEPAASE